MILKRVSTSILLFCCVMVNSGEVLGSSQPYNQVHKVNFGTGNKYHTEEDAVLRSPRLNYNVKRTYNSQSDQVSLAGYGWSISGGEHLIVGADNLHLQQADGRVVYFAESGIDIWQNTNGTKQTITKTANGYQLVRRGGIQKTFDNSGLILSETDLSGNSLSYSYEGSNLTSVTNNFGTSIFFAYSNSKLETITTPIGTVTYSYDANGNLQTVTKPDNGVVQYLYEDPLDVHNLTGVINEEGERVVTVAYDEEDRVISSSLQGGEKAITIEYPGFWERVITDGLGVATTYQLTAKNGVVFVDSFTGPGCSSCGSGDGSSYSYNDRGQVVSSLNALGVETTYVYDENGNRETVTKAHGTADEVTVNYLYTSFNKVAVKTENSIASTGQNKITTNNYDDKGNLLSTTVEGFKNATDSEIHTTNYTYNDYGQLVFTDGPREGVNDTTSLSYYLNDPSETNNRGYLHTVSNALGHTTTYSNYNPLGLAESIIDPNGIETTIQYNLRGQVTSRSTAGLTISYDYDAVGVLQTVHLPGGRSVSYTYTPAGYVETITDSLNNSITYSYDAEGRKIAQIINDPEGKLTAYINYEYDENGRLSKILNPDDTFKEFLYDGVGNLINQLDEKQHLTEYLYDPLNRLTDTIQPTGVTTSITYDLHGNQTSVTDGNGNVTTFTYDDFGNRLSRTSLDTGTTYYSYDSAGNLASKTNANNITITYQYDVLNRVIAVYYPDSSHNVVYGYDEGAYGVGRLTSVQDGVSTTSYAYDQLGNLIRQEKQIGEALFVTEYKYNESNELISIVYPSGRNVDYVRNALGQVTSIDSSYNGESTSIVHDVSRLPFGPIQSMTLGNGAAWNSSYDERYRLSSVSVGDFYSRQYGYLATGQVETITDVLNNQNSQKFSYDELGRLVTALGGYGQYSYNYDAVGNRLDKSYGDQTDTYVYQTGSNRLLEVNSSATTNFSYDEAGNTVAKGDQHYSWTQANRLGSVEVNAETVGQYGYDANGLRVIKNSEGVNRLAIYDAGGNLLAETTEGGEVIREYVYLDGQRITLFDYTVLPQFTLQVVTSEGIAVSNAKAYAFTEQNSYAGIYGTTDEAGNSLFDRTDFVQEMYTFRVDYLGASFWSEPVNVQEADTINILIEDEPTEVQVVLDGAAQEGVKVYAFTEAGSYLGVYGVTDGTGTVTFTLPEGENYLFRADLLGGHYWSSSTTIQAGGIAAVINTGGGELQIFVGQDVDTPLEGLKTYLFTETGSYLGQTSVTTANGLISYTVPSGTYKVRVDYLGYQFWSEPIAITSDGTGEILIPHSPVTFTVTADFNGTQTPLAEVQCYLFTPAESYLQLNGVTDENGQIVFNLPEKAYKLRADYLSQQYWSMEITAEDDTIEVPFGSASVQVTKMGLPVSDIAVYVFNAAGSYLNISGYTDADGVVMFELPAGDYRFRADYQGSQYWGDDLALVASQDNPIEISTGGGSFVLSLTDQDEKPIEGIKTYVFTENGTYLGESALTDGQGQVGFNLADGTYKLRIDYLGYQYWTASFSVPATASLEQVIAHQDVVLTAQTDFAGEVMPVAGARAYLFTPSGTYLNISGTVDANGSVVFRLPPQEYTVRVDYLGRQHWSEVLNQSDATVTIPEGQARVVLQSGSEPLAGVKVYVFSESDSYLNISGTTDAEGGVTFALP